MQSISLNGKWQLTFGPQQAQASETPEIAPIPPADFTTIDAQVPGNVELDMQRAGLLPDLARGENIYKLRPLEGYQWWYRCTFKSPAIKHDQRAVLVFEGLDCIAKCWVNGQLVGEPENMLIAHEFDITDQLCAEGENELVVHIESPVLAGRNRQGQAADFIMAGSFESIDIRKAGHMYGWDIIPRAVSAGLWREVRLDVIEPTHFRNIYFSTLDVNIQKETAQVLVTWDFCADRFDIDNLKIRITLGDGPKNLLEDIQPVIETQGRQIYDLKNVHFWWPRGWGEPHLYTLGIELLDQQNRVIDARQHRVGIRTIKLESTDITTAPQQTNITSDAPSDTNDLKDSKGAFVFKVNGEPIFIRGTNWVPLDAMHCRDTLHLDKTIEMAADLNCNMIRCWGGNVYEDYRFFDLCDRQGLLVWQDFALACTTYPNDEKFCKKMQEEAEQIVSKLRLHPSLALWCGGNEMDQIWPELNQDPNEDRITREVFPRVLRRLDPIRPYIANSPYHGPEYMASGQSDRYHALPELHLWGPRLDYKSDFYTKSSAHFASEIGYHGCPDRASLEQCLDPEYLWPWQDNPQWRAHEVCPHPSVTRFDYRIPLMAKQIEHLFGAVPEKIDDFIFASQASQAEANKFFIEYFRIGKWRRTGIIWWNLRDGWPVISDAVVDYYNRKKLAYDYIKRAQQNVGAIVDEPHSGQHSVAIVNDTLHQQSGRVQITDIDDKNRLFTWDFKVGANSKVLVGKIPEVAGQTMWQIKWSLENGDSYQSHYLAGKPPFDLEQYRKWFKKLGIAKQEC